MQLLDDKLSDSSKNTIWYSVSVLSNYAISREGTLRDVEELPPESLDFDQSYNKTKCVTVIIDQ